LGPSLREHHEGEIGAAAFYECLGERLCGWREGGREGGVSLLSPELGKEGRE